MVASINKEIILNVNVRYSILVSVFMKAGELYKHQTVMEIRSGLYCSILDVVLFFQAQ